MNGNLLEKELFIRVTVRVFRDVYQFLYMIPPFWFVGWDVGFEFISSWSLPFFLLW